jgi:hypothetical protein
MRRPTGFSAFFSLLKSGSAAALALATILSCSDSTSPAEGLDGVIRVEVASVDMVVPDSLKQALAAQFASSLLNDPVAVSANLLVSPVASLASSSCGIGSGFAGYTKSKVPFAPLSSPNIAPFPLKDDGYIPDVSLGFSFSFHGNTYDKVNVYSNGFLMFGPGVTRADGFYRGELIPFAANPNNIIALAWTDWSPQLVPDGIRYETRGTAPNRLFILQFSNVPEYNSGSTPALIKGTGRLTSQLVLAEGSNDITLYTSTMTLVNSSNRMTQGVENANGTEAKYDSIQNPTTGVWSSRVNKFFTGIRLTNDAVRFSLVKVSDEEIPSIIAPENISVGNDPGLASAVVAVGSPVASDNCTEVTVSSARSDGAASDAPYRVGVTTINWTAKDAAGNSASATQTITVLDVEAPVFGAGELSALMGASAHSGVTVNATSPSGAVVTHDLAVTDNVGVTSLVCEPASGSVFPIGNSMVSCSASDAAGNSSSKSFSVSVIGAHEQIANLMEFVKNLGLPNGTANPLINQLKSAYQEQGNECKKVSDFIGMVSKKSSDIDADDAAAMTVEANRIMGALGCTLGSAANRFRTALAN